MIRYKYTQMSMIQSLPGKVLRITMAIKYNVHSVRIIPDSSIIFVEATDMRVHIQYINRHSDTLIFPTVAERDSTMAVVEQHFCKEYATVKKDVLPVTNYPYPQPR